MDPKFRSKNRILPATQKLPSGSSIIRHTATKSNNYAAPNFNIYVLKFFTLHSLKKILFYEVNNKTEHLSCLFAHFLLDSWSPYIFWIVFLLWLRGKESACNAGDPGSFPGLGRSPAEGNGNPLQYSCLENPRDRGT